LIFVLVVVVGLASWFLSADRQHKKDLAEFASAPKDTVFVSVWDTVWHPVVRVKYLTQTVHDTIWEPIPYRADSDTLLYVISADTISERFRAHLEYAQPEPLSPEGFFQNFSVDIRDSVRTVTVTVRQVETVTEYPIPWFIACGAVFGGLGYYLGTR
jgi:hypothetical protein